MWIKIVSEKGKQQSPRAQFRVRPCNPCATSPTKILMGVSLRLHSLSMLKSKYFDHYF